MGKTSALNPSGQNVLSRDDISLDFLPAPHLPTQPSASGLQQLLPDSKVVQAQMSVVVTPD
jgi:hypothetical protein